MANKRQSQETNLLAGQSAQCGSAGLWLLCRLRTVAAIDGFVPKHGPFAIEHIYGFYGIFGFVACVALVLIAKQLRRVLMRPENYYDR